VQAVGILIISAVGVTEADYICVEFKSSVIKPVQRRIHTVPVSVSAKQLSAVGCGIQQFLRGVGVVVAVPADAYYIFIGVKPFHTFKLVLTVTEKDKKVGVRVFPEDPVHMAKAAVGIGKYNDTEILFVFAVQPFRPPHI
jgi:hypothetical protein